MCCLWSASVFLKETATTEIYAYGHTLSLNYALLILSATIATRFMILACKVSRRRSRKRYLRRISSGYSCSPATGIGNSSAALCTATSRAYTRSEEHTSELQSLMRISYAVFCLKIDSLVTSRRVHVSTTENKET